MIGIVAGLFCTLITAWVGSYCFKFDAAWYQSLQKPAFVAPDWVFTLIVSVSYVSSILSVSRLVEYKHIFPSMLFFVGLGVSAVLFILFFFAYKQLLAALVFMTLALMMAFVLFIRFLIKDYKIALEFLPAFLFNMYSYLCALGIAMMN